MLRLPFQRFAISLICVIIFSGHLFAEENQKPLVEKLGRKLTVSVQNAPAGFKNQLMRRNDDTNVLRFSGMRTPFLDADVWAFFLESEAKADQLPALALKLFRSLNNRKAGSVAHCVQFNLTNGAEKSACFFLLDQYEESDTAPVIACKAAIALYGEVSGVGTSEDRRQMTSECVSGS